MQCAKTIRCSAYPRAIHAETPAQVLSTHSLVSRGPGESAVARRHVPAKSTRQSGRSRGVADLLSDARSNFAIFFCFFFLQLYVSLARIESAQMTDRFILFLHSGQYFDLGSTAISAMLNCFGVWEFRTVFPPTNCLVRWFRINLLLWFDLYVL